MPSHNLDAGLLRAAHLLPEQVVRLQVQHARGLPFVIVVARCSLALPQTFPPVVRRCGGDTWLLHTQHPIVELGAAWKTFKEVLPVAVAGGVVMPGGGLVAPPLPRLQVEVVGVAVVVPAPPLPARLHHLVRPVHNASELGTAIAKISGK